MSTILFEKSIDATDRIIGVFMNGNREEGAFVKLTNSFSSVNLAGSGQGEKEEILILVNTYLNSSAVSDEDREYVFKMCLTFSGYAGGLMDYHNLVKESRKMIKSLIKRPSFTHDNIYHWAISNLRKPASVNDAYDESLEGYHTRSSTYISREYYELMTLAVLIRIVLYLGIVVVEASHVTYNNSTKWFRALELFPEEVRNWPGWLRLITYIKDFENKITIKPDDILSLSFDDENKQGMLMSVVIFKVLVTGKVLQIDDDRHIVSLLYSKVAGDNSRNNYASSTIKDKIPSSNTEGDPDNSSILESYRTISPRSIADIALLQMRGEEGYLLAQVGHLIKKKDYHALKKQMDSQVVYVSLAHVRILTVALHALMPPEAFYYFEKEHIKPLLIIGSLLLRKNHPYLSLILLANADKSVEGETVYASHVGETKLTTLDKEELDKRFPINQVLLTYKGTGNPIHDHIEDVAKEISNYSWTMKVMDDFIESNEYVKNKASLEGHAAPATLIKDLSIHKGEIITGLKKLLS